MGSGADEEQSSTTGTFGLRRRAKSALKKLTTPGSSSIARRGSAGASLPTPSTRSSDDNDQGTAANYTPKHKEKEKEREEKKKKKKTRHLSLYKPEESNAGSDNRSRGGSGGSGGSESPSKAKSPSRWSRLFRRISPRRTARSSPPPSTRSSFSDASATDPRPQSAAIASSFSSSSSFISGTTARRSLDDIDDDVVWDTRKEKAKAKAKRKAEERKKRKKLKLKLKASESAASSQGMYSWLRSWVLTPNNETEERKRQTYDREIYEREEQEEEEGEEEKGEEEEEEEDGDTYASHVAPLERFEQIDVTFREETLGIRVKSVDTADGGSGAGSGAGSGGGGGVEVLSFPLNADGSSGEAARSGRLMVGDVITSVGGVAISSSQQFSDIVHTLPRPVRITFKRSIVKGGLRAGLQQLPARSEARAAPPASAAAVGSSERSISICTTTSETGWFDALSSDPDAPSSRRTSFSSAANGPRLSLSLTERAAVAVASTLGGSGRGAGGGGGARRGSAPKVSSKTAGVHTSEATTSDDRYGNVSSSSSRSFFRAIGSVITLPVTLVTYPVNYMMSTASSPSSSPSKAVDNSTSFPPSSSSSFSSSSASPSPIGKKAKDENRPPTEAATAAEQTSTSTSSSSSAKAASDGQHRSLSSKRRSFAHRLVHSQSENLDDKLRSVFVSDSQGHRSALLTMEDKLRLNEFLPLTLQDRCLERFYDTSVDGMSILNLYRMAGKKGPLLLLIREDHGNIFGAFLSRELLTEGKNFCDGRSFVFKLRPTFEGYRWTGRNGEIISSNRHYLAIGGGSGVAIMLFEDLTVGRSSPCETFNEKTPLSKEEDFHTITIEAWGFGAFGL